MEWVALLGEGDKAPRIRIARPVTAVRYEGTRKRRRAAMGDYNWSVGDRVDALIRDRYACTSSKYVSYDSCIVRDEKHNMETQEMLNIILKELKGENFDDLLYMIQLF